VGAMNDHENKHKRTQPPHPPMAETILEPVAQPNHPPHPMQNDGSEAGCAFLAPSGGTVL